jgi:hypothetical protein
VPSARARRLTEQADPLHRLETSRAALTPSCARFRDSGVSSVPPDGTTILYVTLAKTGSDLMLIESFR